MSTRSGAQMTKKVDKTNLIDKITTWPSIFSLTLGLGPLGN